MNYVSLPVLEEMVMVVLAFSGCGPVRLGNGLIRNGMAVGKGC